MVGYIKQIANGLAKRFDPPTVVNNLAETIRGLAEELNRLDPREFVVGSQSEFFHARLDVRHLATIDGHRWGALCQPISGYDANAATNKAVFERVSRVLDHYAGMGTRAIRSFAFVQNSEVRAIVERDYKELALVLLPGFAWKSAVVLAGSILEAILYDRLTRDAAQTAQTMASLKAPKKGPKGATLARDITDDTSENEWKLFNLIAVAVDLGFLPDERAKTIDQVLRDYRNFIHPRKEIKAAHPCTEAEATQAKGALDAVCNLFET